MNLTSEEQLRTESHAISCDEPSQDPHLRLKQIGTITAAYKSLSSTEPILPSPNSPLPALLALRKTLNTVEQTKLSIQETQEEITKANARLRQEGQDLRNAQELTGALEKRIEKLRADHEELTQQTPEERVQAAVQREKQKARHYTIEMRKQMKAFNSFVDQHLSGMIAAEDLGGPVVGDLIDVDPEILKAGFTAQGKPKKAKKDSATAEAERKWRNNELWGSEDLDPDHKSRDEREAAGADFRSLTEDLLNAAAGDEDSGPYIDIRRESAAVRFLVRSKIARFHPDDARKLRLMDFGKDLDDEKVDGIH